MVQYCFNHTQKKALSFCSVCKNYYCKECLVEGKEYYYCNNKDCYSQYLKELESYEFNPRFCLNCVEESIPETAGDVDTINLVGTVLYNMGKECPICHSTIAKKCYTIFGFNTKIYGYYRVIYLKKYIGWFSSEKTFISRKLKFQALAKLPKVVECPQCEEEVSLDENERNSKQFTCPYCAEFIDFT